MNDESLLLPGLDGSNPLAYLASLGLLQALSDSGPPRGSPAVWRLCWRDEGRWLALIHGCRDPDEIISRLLTATASWGKEMALNMAYDAKGERIPADSEHATFDLKPSPEAFRSFADEAAERCSPRAMLSVRAIAAYGSELVTANKGDLKPTALHFTAGNQRFLAMVRSLQKSICADDFREALFGPWRNTSELPSLSWNASAPRVYAYRASDPSKEKRGSVPGADWLAFIGLRFFPVVSHGTELRTTCISGGWRNGTMRWPIWSPALSVNVIRSLLALKDLRDETKHEQFSAMGVVALYESAILRSDQGGYGSFSPARPL